MSKQTKQEKQRRKLLALEQEFSELLISSLHKCVATRGCFFLTGAEANRRGDVYVGLVWPETKTLVKLSAEIDTLRSEVGYSQPNMLIAAFRGYCGPKTPNELGDARRAEQFLQQIESGAFNQESYGEMANDAARERDADEWCEGLLPEAPDE